MQLDDRIAWLIVGCVVGFVVGYLVRSLREVEEELTEVKQNVSTHRHDFDERGSIKFPEPRNLVLLLVIALTVYAAFASQIASNNVRDQQVRVEQVSMCNQEYLNRTIVALNERTTYSTQQARANVDLQRSQAQFLQEQLTDPPLSDARLQGAQQDYFTALTTFIELASRSATKAAENPYPKPAELSSCLAGN